MTKRDGQRIGDVGRVERRGKPKLLLDGRLDLTLGSSPIAGEQFFDFRRRVRGDWDTCLSRSQADDAARVPHQNRSSWTFVVRVQLFDREEVRRVLSQDLRDTFKQFLEPRLERAIARNANHPGIDQPNLQTDHAQHSISGNAERRVNSKNRRTFLHANTIPVVAL